MNKSLRSFLILISWTVVAILIIVVLLWLSLSEKEDRNDESFFDSFVSAHTDEDIVNYVTKEHDLDVEVIDNQGPKQPKTGRGGSARVETNDGMEFEVFINSFGAITGARWG